MTRFLLAGSYLISDKSSCLQIEPPQGTSWAKLVVPGGSMFIKEQHTGQQSSERGKEFENCMNTKVRK